MSYFWLRRYATKMPARAKSPAPAARLTRRQQKQEEEEIAAVLELSAKTVELESEPAPAPAPSATVAVPPAGELSNKSGRPSVILAAAGASLLTPVEKPSWRLPVMPPAW